MCKAEDAGVTDDQNQKACHSSLMTFPGIATGAAAFAVNTAVENISGFKFWAMLSLINRSGNLVWAFILYILINATLVACAVLVTLHLGPAAAGSGIAEVKVRGSPLMHVRSMLSC